MTDKPEKEMELAPYSQFDNLNRSALLIRRKQAFVDWCKSVFADQIDLGDDLGEECNVYLTMPLESPDHVDAFLRANWRPIFEEELANWCRDRKSWPENLSYQKFIMWFDVEHHSMIFDLGRGKIQKIR